MGSTADELIHHSHLPILLVRPGTTHPTTDAAPSIQRIAIPLDGSAIAEQILEPALTLGTSFNAEYTLIRVVDVDVDGGIPDMVRDPQLEHDLMSERVQSAESYLDGIAEHLRLKGARVATRVLVAIEPVSALLREIDTHHYDLVALATHGRGGLPRLLLGSVADKVVRRSPVPVLVCHPQLSETGLPSIAAAAEEHVYA
jgi:nucleotide-binding universal stress UspA family protein